MKEPRMPQFLFEPEAFATDPAVLAMSPLGRGAYVMILCRAWTLREPGIVTPATDSVLASYGMVSPDEWQTVRDEVALAFDTESRPGSWVQKRMAATFAEQQDWIRHKSAGGKARSEVAARSDVGRFKPTRSTSRRPAGVQQTSSSAPADVPAGVQHTSSDIGLGLGLESKSTHLATGVAAWVSCFEQFWSAYPHYAKRSLKAEARRRWAAMRPRPPLAAVMAGLRSCAESPDWTKDDGRYVPGAHVWLGRRGWDASDGVDATHELAPDRPPARKLRTADDERREWFESSRAEAPALPAEVPRVPAVARPAVDHETHRRKVLEQAAAMREGGK